MTARAEGRKKSSRLDRNKVAQAIFAQLESMGISDRKLSEQLTEGVIERLQRQGTIQPLPGMEDLVAELGGPRSLTATEMRSLVKEVLAEKGRPEIARAFELQGRKRRRAPGEIIKTSPNAKTVLERRYLKKDSEGRVVETVDELFRRVAKNIASADLLYNPAADIKAREEEFYEAMANLEFLPNSPTLMNAGRELQQLSACFVLPIEDSMDSIFDAVKHTALIHKSGGGTGFSFSRLRPEGDSVGSTGGVASGPVSFMRAFDTATDVIKQGGMRRGANMAILNVDHPDISEFINAKKDPDAFNNFNLSVAVTEEFMKAVESGAEYNLINPRSKRVFDRRNARGVFDQIVDMAWKNGDPGIVFLDRVNRDNPTPKLGAIESTNPCGEQPLLPYESCNLGSINLAKMVTQRDGSPAIDYDKLEKIVGIAVRFLDNVIDVNNFPLDKIAQMTKATRKIGLGVMGFADMLIKLGISYDSEEALGKAKQVMDFIQEKASEASEALAKERGVFPAFEGSVYDVPGGLRVRNATRTTIAPTGTLSIIAGCSSGIEPLFALTYVRNIMDEDRLVEINPLFDEVAKREGFYSEDLLKTLATRGSIRGMDNIPQWVQGLFVTAHDITPEWHVRMQAAFQRSTNNAVSKTVNFPYDATREDVARVFILAYKEGCKGITIYRDRSRDKQVLTVSKEEKAEGLVPRERPTTTMGLTQKVATGCGNIYVTVNSDEQGVCEVFSSLGKAGGCASAQLEAISRLISLALRSGVDVPSIVKHLKGIRCPSIVWEKGHAVLSCPDAIGAVLEKELRTHPAPRAELAPKARSEEPRDEAADIPELAPRTRSEEVSSSTRNLAGQCPDCGSLLIYQEGCFICRFCGYTKCE